MLKQCWMIINKPWKTLTRMLHDYQGALKDLDKVYVLEPDNASTLNSCERVKYMLNDYQRPLDDFNKVDVLEPNNAFTL
jgi:tetratricopeptide (TPR) repeat protein